MQKAVSHRVFQQRLERK